jgi:hypothetical protein
LRFTSDYGTTASGWNATWNCSTVPSASIIPNKTTYLPGEQITLTYTGASGTTDWIGIYKQGQSPSTASALVWAYINPPGGTKIFNVNSLAAGTYEAYLFCCNGYTVKAKTVVFTVKDKGIAANKSSYIKGDQMVFTYAGASGTTDWIGIYKQGQSPSTASTQLWSYVTAGNGTKLFSSSSLAVGTYEAYLFCCDGYTVKAKSTPFMITTTSTTTFPDPNGSGAAKEFKVYPNPSAGSSIIEFEEETSGIIEVIDLSGRLVYQVTIEKTMSYNINISTLNKGIYFIRFNGTNCKLILH